jgi:hypothetical protein
MEDVLIVIKKEEKMDMNGHVLPIITLYIYAALRSTIKDWLAWNQDNVFK